MHTAVVSYTTTARRIFCTRLLEICVVYHVCCTCMDVTRDHGWDRAKRISFLFLFISACRYHALSSVVSLPQAFQVNQTTKSGKWKCRLVSRPRFLRQPCPRTRPSFCSSRQLPLSYSSHLRLYKHVPVYNSSVFPNTQHLVVFRVSCTRTLVSLELAVDVVQFVHVQDSQQEEYLHNISFFCFIGVLFSRGPSCLYFCFFSYFPLPSTTSL